MNAAEAHAIVDLLATDNQPSGAIMLEDNLAQAKALRTWVEGREAKLVGALALVVSFPERALADTQRVSLREAEQAVRRAAFLAAVPAVATALEQGRITAAHVDMIERAVRSLEPREKPALLAEIPRLLGLAEQLAVDRFGRPLRRARDRARFGEGVIELEQQRRSVKVATWTDTDTGMWHLHGEFDPLTGARIAKLLRDRTEALFHDRHPAGVPSAPLARHAHLRGLALVDLLVHRGGGPGRIELSGVIDLTDHEPGEPVVVDWGLPIDVPALALADLKRRFMVDIVIVANGRVLDPTGALDLGRTVRKATRAQRRGLKALYRTCAIPGCAVCFDDCTMHHVRWWRHGGRTDLANLLPVCSKHHHCIHDRGWAVELGPDRALTVRTPDGREHRGGPNRRRSSG